jgi:DNA photolyase
MGRRRRITWSDRYLKYFSGDDRRKCWIGGPTPPGSAGRRRKVSAAYERLIPMTTIVWFRQDLRTRDNPALAAAAARGVVIPTFILEDESPGSPRQSGAAGRWWVHHSLAAFRKNLGHLALFRGSQICCPTSSRCMAVSAVYWNRRASDDAVILTAPACLKRLGREMRMLVDGSDDQRTADPACWRPRGARPATLASLTHLRRRVGAFIGGFEAGLANRRLRGLQPSRAGLNMLIGAAGPDITARAR